MERGLLWTPLLIIFIWLAWAGWNEYQKLEAYKVWAQEFERAKYDIYAALGQTGEHLAWGRPTRKGPEEVQHISLHEVTKIALYTRDNLPASAQLPKGCQIGLSLTLNSGNQRWIPFTDAELASAWQNQLQTLQESLQSTPQP
ncbi:hypothetical protein PN498_04800 [Oscillatoria sp. CS-180]|uniref:hypothetical protein n=1 Tax=Oscillatoria sp. CS-180 TaxID=3021720 RepID=UPI00232E958D|nr:hypothetical protein [Oscillatoria sp. CS-180]MDB9525296.1 hypothetical protein [Oscillatoria sp. CS-180]